VNGSANVPITTMLSAQPLAPVPGGPVTVTFSGEPGRVYDVEGSTNLVNWTRFTTVTNSLGTIPVVDPNLFGLRHRFYRIRLVP